MRFLVTGANGFVGRALCAELLRRGYAIRAAVRSEDARIDNVEQAIVGPIGSGTDWATALRDVDVVIHLAARVHVMRETAGDPLAEFLEVNLHGTENLARQAARAGVKRLVYVSSIGVNGLQTASGKPFSESDAPNPHNAYALSKLEAEQILSRISAETGLEIVIVRPPLVYGGNAPGNFAQMVKTLKRGIPLPLASVRNKRSLIYLGNLVDALILCATAPEASGKTYLVSDGKDVSTPELLRQLGAAMRRPARLFPCPPTLLKLAGRLTGKSVQVERLLGSLQVDSNKIRQELDWQPPYTLEQGLHATAAAFVADRDYPCN
ncbi:MAG: SDR family oxidoreductase [Gallionella sp.]|nr:SDR family oxidoreductase [Gallionella sp.]